MSDTNDKSVCKCKDSSHGIIDPIKLLESESAGNTTVCLQSLLDEWAAFGFEHGVHFMSRVTDVPGASNGNRQLPCESKRKMEKER